MKLKAAGYGKGTLRLLVLTGQWIESVTDWAIRITDWGLSPIGCPAMPDWLTQSGQCRTRMIGRTSQPIAEEYRTCCSLFCAPKRNVAGARHLVKAYPRNGQAGWLNIQRGLPPRQRCSPQTAFGSGCSVITGVIFAEGKG